MAKKYETLTFKDSYMFGKIMEDTELCKGVLEVLLDKKIETLTRPEREKEMQVAVDGKPVRFDIYTRNESENEVYDLEMQNLNHHRIDDLALPKRTRYYQAMIDSDLLSPGDDYSQLPFSNIIFICTFDPFGYNMFRYTFSECCVENCDIKLGDETQKTFYNTTAVDSYAPSDLKALYEYINTGNATNELTHKLAAAVEFGRRNAEWKADYMRLSTHDMDTFRFGKIEGLEEGRAQGLEEGHAQGLEEGHAQGLEEGQIRTLIGMLRKNVISEQTVCDELCIDSIKLQELLVQYK